MATLDTSLTAVKSLTQQWVEQVVVGLNLCPFAAPVVRQPSLMEYAVFDGELDQLPAYFLSQLDKLQSQPPEVLETALLIVPSHLADFHDYLAMLDTLEGLISEAGLQGVIQLASFHPQYQFAGLPADDITHWTNRSPYPTFHLLREASLEKAIAAFGDTEKIPERNMAFFEQLQAKGLIERFAPFADYAQSS